MLGAILGTEETTFLFAETPESNIASNHVFFQMYQLSSYPFLHFVFPKCGSGIAFSLVYIHFVSFS